MPSVIPLDRLLGASLVGVVVSAIIYGITCLQTYLYYTKYSTDDRRVVKFIVAILWVLDSSHMALVTIVIYHYTISNWGDLTALSRPTWTLDVQIVFAGTVTLIVQWFYAYRIWLFSKNWLLTGVIVILSLFGLGFGIGFTVHAFHSQFFSTKRSRVNSFLVGTFLSGDIACDIVIAASMCYYLHRNRTGLKRTDTMINLLITYAIRTGLLTTIFTATCMVTFIMLPSVMIYQPFYFIGCRLYVNSLLSTLNVRESIRDKGRPQGSISLPTISLPTFAGNNTNSSSNADDTVATGLSSQRLPIIAGNKCRNSGVISGMSKSLV